MANKRPVTNSGWYANDDGTFSRVEWASGQMHESTPVSEETYAAIIEEQTNLHNVTCTCSECAAQDLD